MKRGKAALIGAGCGLFVGMVMTFFVLSNCLGDSSVAHRILEKCNYPADLFASCFHPSLMSDGALFTTIGAIVMQWVLVGTIVGLLVGSKRG